MLAQLVPNAGAADQPSSQKCKRQWRQCHPLVLLAWHMLFKHFGECHQTVFALVDWPADLWQWLPHSMQQLHMAVLLFCLSLSASPPGCKLTSSALDCRPHSTTRGIQARYASRPAHASPAETMCPVAFARLGSSATSTAALVASQCSVCAVPAVLLLSSYYCQCSEYALAAVCLLLEAPPAHAL